MYFFFFFLRDLRLCDEKKSSPVLLEAKMKLAGNHALLKDNKKKQ